MAAGGGYLPAAQRCGAGHPGGAAGLLGFTSEARWVRYAHADLGHLFPYLPQQPGYNKRLRAAAALVRHCIRVLAASTSQWTDDVWIVDSTPGGMRPVPGHCTAV